MEPEKVPSYGWYSFKDLKRLSNEGLLVPNMRLALDDLEDLLS
jgi:hypothetical protein